MGPSEEELPASTPEEPVSSPRPPPAFPPGRSPCPVSRDAFAPGSVPGARSPVPSGTAERVAAWRPAWFRSCFPPSFRRTSAFFVGFGMETEEAAGDGSIRAGGSVPPGLGRCSAQESFAADAADMSRECSTIPSAFGSWAARKTSFPPPGVPPRTESASSATRSTIRHRSVSGLTKGGENVSQPRRAAWNRMENKRFGQIFMILNPQCRRPPWRSTVRKHVRAGWALGRRGL